MGWAEVARISQMIIYSISLFLAIRANIMLMENQYEIILYQTGDGATRIQVLLENEQPLLLLRLQRQAIGRFSCSRKSNGQRVWNFRKEEIPGCEVDGKSVMILA
jgi:hypothetical protein